MNKLTLNVIILKSLMIKSLTQIQCTKNEETNTQLQGHCVI